MLRFIAHAKHIGLSPASIHVYISGVVSLHHMLGFQPPPTTSYKVRLAIRAINSQQITSNSRQPITYKILHSMVTCLHQLDLCYPWIAMLTLGFFGALRGAEYTAVPQSTGVLLAPFVHQVSFHRVGCAWAMVYSMPKTKTTTNSVRVPIGCSGTSVCAVCSMLQYMDHRQSTGTLHPDSYLFVDHNGRPISKCNLNQVIKRLSTKLGLGNSYTTHSLRAGAATTASAAGFNEHEIQQLGHWASQAYTTYITPDYQHRYAFAKRLAALHN